MSDELKAIEQYVDIINVTLPDGIDGEGPIRQALGEIVAEATSLDSARNTAEDRLDRLRDAYLDTEDDFADLAKRTGINDGLSRREFVEKCRQYLRPGDLPEHEELQP
jgi:hypothetical protein